MKYPRTYHLPFSPGATKDDKKLKDGWFDFYKGKEVVFTEKLDGENTCMSEHDVYARSHGAPTRSPWSRNLWDDDGLYWKVKPYIGTNELLFGENLYGEHSIHYDCLTDYWHMFAISDGARWYGWDEVKEFARIIGVPCVPELHRCVLRNESDVKEIVEHLMENHGSYYGRCQKEGIVMRVVESFDVYDFPKFVCKYVRANHVQTDEHWTRKWKKAELEQTKLT